MDILLPEFKKMLLILKKHEVKFILIGGYAVIYYGFDRATQDMDIWVEPGNENRDKLTIALKEFGVNEDDLKKLSNLDFRETQFFFFGKKPRRIDFLTRINIVSFDEAYAEANHFPLEDKMIPIINYNHLILSKITNERSKDKVDVEELQKINKLKNKK